MFRAAKLFVGDLEDVNDLQESLDARKVRRLVADGHTWLVREVAAPLADRRGPSSLVFDAEVVVRRVRQYPADWFKLSDEELYALTDHRRAD